MVVLREILIWEFFSYFFPLKQNYECCKKEKNFLSIQDIIAGYYYRHLSFGDLKLQYISF